jgi:AraC family transcriptional regulator
MHPRIARAIRFIELQIAYCQEKPEGFRLTLEDVAAAVRMGAFNFHRLFTAETGVTLKDFINRVRLDGAALRLRYTRDPISVLAQGSGFADVPSFSRAFARHFGLPPGRFRRQAWLNPLTAEPGPVQQTLDSVRVMRVPPFTLWSLRMQGHYYSDMPSYWQRFAEMLRSHGLQAAASTAVVRIFDDPRQTPAGRQRMEFCCGPRGQVRPPDFDEVTVEGGDYAVLSHRGSYAEAVPQYEWLLGVWMLSAGRTMAHRPAFEWHHRPLMAPSTAWAFDIFMPLLPDKVAAAAQVFNP